MAAQIEEHYLRQPQPNKNLPMFRARPIGLRFLASAALFAVSFYACMLQAQSLPSAPVWEGLVVDQEGTPLPFAELVIDGQTGTLSDASGRFAIALNPECRVAVSIAYTGCTALSVALAGCQALPDSLRLPCNVQLGTVVVQHNLKEEVQWLSPAPVSVLEGSSLQGNPMPAFEQAARFPAVTMSQSSLTFNAINTRGFADMQNFRFVVFADGAETAFPGLGYTVGGNATPSDLDVQRMELVPGPQSALYGANAFNGMMHLQSWTPFNKPGLSAFAKGGSTVQNAGGSNAFGHFGFRYADRFRIGKGNKPRFGYQFSGSLMTGTDWAADDASFYINPQRVSIKDSLLALPEDHPNFDAVNRYGDEVVATVNLGGSDTAASINRSGIDEADLVDYRVQQWKADLGLFAQLGKRQPGTLRYQFRYRQTDAILRHTTIYPFVNLQYTQHQLSWEGKNGYITAYHSAEDFADSYALLATGAFIEEGRKSSALWGEEYGAAFRGEITGVEAGSHAAARTYADRDLPGPESAVFQDLRAQSLENPDLASGGSKFIDRSSMFHVGGHYRMDHWFKQWLELTAGGHFRRILLDSEGQVFNDGALGFNKPIPVLEGGGFLQASKALFQDRLKLSASLRYDKNQNFEGRLTPRGTLWFGLDKAEQHGLWASVQTGFRNPSPTETYLTLDIGPVLLLGGTQDNISNYQYALPNGSVVAGQALWDGFVTLGSFICFQQTGDPSCLEAANLDFVRQERIRSADLGYRGRVSLGSGQLQAEANVYAAQYDDFVVRQTVFSPEAGRLFAAYTNLPESVYSWGSTLQLTYQEGSKRQWTLGYHWTDFDADDAVAAEPGFQPGFNTPKHQLRLGLQQDRIGTLPLGFRVDFRYVDAYTWQSPFGEGAIPAYHSADLSIFYTLESLGSRIALVASNAYRNEYRTVYGGPQVGSIYALSWTFDEALLKARN